LQYYSKKYAAIEKNKKRFSTTAICMSFALFGCDLSNKPDVNALNVSHAKLDGKCLLNREWVSVQGEHLHWEIKNKTDTVIREHAFMNLNQIVEKQLSLKQRYDPYTKAYFWWRGSGDKTEKLESYRKEYKNSELWIYTFGYLVGGTELNFINSRPSSEIFNTEREFYVPAGDTVCEIKKTWIMKDAKVEFITSFWSGHKILKDETTKIDVGTDPKGTFAQQLLQEIYPAKF
jgi:hypothetical protein